LEFQIFLLPGSSEDNDGGHRGGGKSEGEESSFDLVEVLHCDATTTTCSVDGWDERRRLNISEITNKEERRKRKKEQEGGNEKKLLAVCAPVMLDTGQCRLFRGEIVKTSFYLY
jgi:hypothetical protein